ncbi:ROK family protein [Stappia sp. F7233]|uniref:ROK family protein n=1 Tax=Stappia albiluteola TaxID=2758565 RepID=A0A839A943_9HYPH|nr:ROK family protein [Stappia albiluteola]MBA5776053.1 ROK family protein [Stappia albiluteola]
MAERPRTGRGSNSVQLRRYNERIVLQALRRVGEASKADLARHAHLTNAAIGGIIQELEAEGLIQTLGKRHDGGRGQPATMLRLDAGGAFGIGVRLDRTSLETVLVDFSGRVIGRRAHDMILPAPEKARDIITRDVVGLIDLLDKAQRDRVAGIGLGMPFNLGSWLSELGLPGETFRLWDEVDFAALLEEALPYPVFGENDATAATIAELFYGVGRTSDDFLYIFIGPAIGGGIVVNGDCLRGMTGNAGHFAVMPVPPSKLASAPKPKGPWELLITRASLAALGRHLAYQNHETSSRTDLEEAVEQKLPAVEEWLDDCVDALLPAIWSAHAIADAPNLVLDADIDGGLIDRMIAMLRQRLAETAPEARQPPEILRGSFGPDAGAIGAASLPMFFNFSPRASILIGEDQLRAERPGPADRGGPVAPSSRRGASLVSSRASD